MIVLDTSTLVSAAFRRVGIPERAVNYALHQDLVAVSIEQLNELLDVPARPRLYRFLDQDLGANLIQTLYSLGVPFTPTERVTDCRDPKDNKFLELALAAGADLIVSSDADLLVLSPWRGIPILKPAEYLALKSA